MISSIMLHLAFHVPIDGQSVFSVLESKNLPKGLFNIFLPVVSLIPQWSLSLVFSKLMNKPTEPMVSADLFCLL